ncbi:MAG: TIGR03862 family flavoprotein [Alphaproteobacteria bacterium]|nr:TIGR03862 family flavoprotein [Alphaproteobacteria bacterium]MCB9985052.1 TIGR03862 family flavoprotein [Micavibrio sp.]HPQ51485.1 TIGR03862 family flavoprotein [Alphaproteobacteria bacterium]
MKTIAIIGAGPGGLMAAESLARLGYTVDVYDHKPSPARKFLMAGRGGLNITHSEPIDSFLQKYGEAAEFMHPMIGYFTPKNMRIWCAELGEETFIGTSGRIFPKSFKSSPLLRSWLERLSNLNVRIHPRHHWTGWNEKGELAFTTPEQKFIKADATILALGGASWPKLGSDGSWVNELEKHNIEIAPLRPANCGFCVNWSDIFKSKFAGTPLKSITLTHEGKLINGEIMISEKGLEGGVIYALSKSIRTAIETKASTTLTIDLKPDLTIKQLEEKLSHPRGRDTQTNFLRKQTNLSPAAINLLYECGDKTKPLAQQIKQIQIPLTQPCPIDRAISSAGGIKLDELDKNLMLKKMPSVFAIGEMLDWEAPTGGYLLQATFSMGVFVAQGVDKYFKTANI